MRVKHVHRCKLGHFWTTTTIAAMVQTLHHECSIIGSNKSAHQHPKRCSIHCYRPLPPTAIRPTHQQPQIVVQAVQGFHQQRLAATDAHDRATPLTQLAVRSVHQHLPLVMNIHPPRHADTDEELHAIAALRALSFYAYPPEREFAGRVGHLCCIDAFPHSSPQRHQLMIAEEEFKALKQQQWARSKAEDANERTATLVATCAASLVEDVDERLLLPTGDVVVGTCDVYAVRALPGEVLIGTGQIVVLCHSSLSKHQGTAPMRHTWPTCAWRQQCAGVTWAGGCCRLRGRLPGHGRWSPCTCTSWLPTSGR